MLDVCSSKVCIYCPPVTSSPTFFLQRALKIGSSLRKDFRQKRPHETKQYNLPNPNPKSYALRNRKLFMISYQHLFCLSNSYVTYLCEYDNALHSASGYRYLYVVLPLIKLDKFKESRPGRVGKEGGVGVMCRSKLDLMT